MGWLYRWSSVLRGPIAPGWSLCYYWVYTPLHPSSKVPYATDSVRHSGAGAGLRRAQGARPGTGEGSPGYAGEDDGAAPAAPAGLSQQLFSCGPVLHPGAYRTLGWPWIVVLYGHPVFASWYAGGDDGAVGGRGGWRLGVRRAGGCARGAGARRAVEPVSSRTGAAPPDRRRVPVRLGARRLRATGATASSRCRPKRSPSWASVWRPTCVPTCRPFWRPSTKSSGVCMPGSSRCVWVAAATPSSRAGPGSTSRPWLGDGRNCTAVAFP